MKKKELKTKELKKLEAKALSYYGTDKLHLIQKNHRRIMWLKKYLGISLKPKRISVAELLLQRMVNKQ